MPRPEAHGKLPGIRAPFQCDCGRLRKCLDVLGELELGATPAGADHTVGHRRECATLREGVPMRCFVLCFLTIQAGLPLAAGVVGVCLQ